MEKDSNPIKLLLVDDEADFREATASALMRRGFIVRDASSGAEALKLIPKGKYDIVVLDLRMPGMDGIETLGKIREIEEKLPVIILTGHGRFQDAVAGINLEIVDFLQKPVDIEELEHCIHKFFTGEVKKSLRERTIAELMVPASVYPKLYVDQPVKEALSRLMAVFFPTGLDNAQVPVVRSAIVYTKDEAFLGIIRFPDLMKLVMPPFLGESPYSSYYTGMFLAQCKMIGQRSIWELLNKQAFIDINAPLMEAVHLMIEHSLINLPVLNEGKLMGVLRERDIILEIAKNIGVEDVYSDDV